MLQSLTQFDEYELHALALTLENRELKQRRRRRQRERHLKMWLRLSALIFQLFRLIMLEKCVLTILELNWNQRLGHKTTKLNICHHMLTSSTQLQNRSFHVVERTRTSTKCQKMKNARAKRAKILFFFVKYANLWGFCWKKTFLRISSIRKIAVTWILARVFAYVPSFYFQILDLIYWMILIFYFDLFWMAWHWKPPQYMYPK